ncbi:MAG: LysM peptidoglycan-binding domain-containing protein [Chloroflexi bacterium]|nr:LysM peptidoglycan-binding domain-containing protein [Chloroflexota bacterium]
MTMIFSALSDKATIFLRAIVRETDGGESRVWLDAVCMEERPEIPPIAVTAPPQVQMPAQTPTQTPAPPVAQPAPSAGETTYTVQSGDTLFGIARKTGASVQAISAANNISNPSLIKPGQVLKIPK